MKEEGEGGGAGAGGGERRQIVFGCCLYSGQHRPKKKKSKGASGI